MKTFVIGVMLMLYACANDEIETNTMQGLCGNGGNHTCCPGSPIVIDLGGDGIHLSSAADGVRWTLNPGETGQWAWTLPGTDDAFLVMDRNHNGVIDDGSEMFGNNTLQLANTSPNGFKALAYLDLPSQSGNGDGILDAHDTAWTDLALWIDINHDAVSQPSELFTLGSKGIRSLDTATTASTDVDKYGNEFRFESTLVAAAPVGTVTRDVWLQQTPIQTVVSDVTEWNCKGWVYAMQTARAANSTQVLCSNRYVTNDPIVTNLAGSLSRLISRTAVDTDRQAAIDRLKTNFSTILVGDNPNCVTDTFIDYDCIAAEACEASFQPSPDPVGAAPYDWDPNPGFILREPRIKCTSHVVVSNPPPTSPCFK